MPLKWPFFINLCITETVNFTTSAYWYFFLTASWFVPCEDCKNPNSCHWKTAIWQPKFCQTTHLDDYDIRACFKGRKVLFIGDSTNRGILHYILEKINGSLSEWDKTHNLKLYKSINGNQTDLSFSYYPQFWLPTNHRPAFDKAIFQLIKWLVQSSYLFCFAIIYK